MSTGFRIRFDETPRPLPEWALGSGAWATVEIGHFCESIVIPTDYWGRMQYYEQWYAACRRLLVDHATAAFLVDVTAEWCVMDKCFAWVGYPADSVVYLQNMLLWPPRFPRAGLQNAHLAAQRRRTRSDEPGTEGMPVSEWVASAVSIEVFAASLRNQLLS